MADGPGKYDEVCMKAMQETEAETVLLVVINGNKGEGFSVTSYDPNVKKNLPKWLRNAADQIEGVS